MNKGAYVPSMSAIARETGVAISTVSRVLQNDPRISKQTRENVLESAERLGYASNLLVKGLRGEGTRTVGVSMSLADEYHARLLNGISNEMWKKGYAPLYLHARNHSGFEEHKVFKGFMERRIDGVIARPVDYDEVKEFYEELIARGLPLVLIDCDIPGVDIPFSGTDNYLGGSLAAQLLFSLGHKVIGHAQGFQYGFPGGFRRRGFEDFFKNCPNVKLLFCNETEAEISKMLLAKPSPTAIFAWNDHAAATIYDVAKKEKIRIPDDLSVIGFGNLSFAKHMNPPLTTFEQNPERIAENAVSLFLGEISGKSKKRGNGEHRILVKPELIIRGSTVKKNCVAYKKRRKLK